MRLQISTLSEVGEHVQGEYDERDGKFYLRLDGDPRSTHSLVSLAELTESNDKVVEFRDNNRSLMSKQSTMETELARFDGFDTSEPAKLKARIAELEAAADSAPNTDDLTERISKAVEQAQTPLLTKITELETKNAASEEKAAESDRKVETEGIKNALTQVGIEQGVRKEAMADYLARGTGVFVMEDGVPVAMKGDTPLFSQVKPAERLTMSEWAEDLAEAAGHLFEGSSGGGAAHDSPGGPTVKKRIADADIGAHLEDVARGGVEVALRS
jgi:hypothetical protein